MIKPTIMTAACAAVFTTAAFAGQPSKAVVAPEPLYGVGMYGALEGGVNASLNLDFHGKSFGYLLLGMTVEVGR